MSVVVGIAFRSVSKIYHFDATGYEDLEAGDHVVVETTQGRAVGRVALSPRSIPNEEVDESLKPVLRRANAWDMLQQDQYQHREAEALEICKQRIADLNLPMKLVRTEYNFDGGRLVVQYTAEKRVDFRALVRDLARTFKTRIEMKQIGVRDEAKLLDGIGRCGRQLCCSSWLREFTQISVRMAKNQDLPLNPSEISGVCGRLLCCLSYEDDQYTDLKKGMPKVGNTIATPSGQGRVCQIYALRGRIEVELQDGSRENFDREELNLGKKGEGQSHSACDGCSLTRRLAEDDSHTGALGAG